MTKFWQHREPSVGVRRYADRIGVVYTKKGDYSAILKMENPVRKYSGYESKGSFFAGC